MAIAKGNRRCRSSTLRKISQSLLLSTSQIYQICSDLSDMFRFIRHVRERERSFFYGLVRGFSRQIYEVSIPPGHVYAINDALSADDYEIYLNQLVKNKVVELSAATGLPKFDLMLLGLGLDGHVASLFPGHPLVSENKRWVAFIEDSPNPPPKRITFTFPVKNSSAYVALVVGGASKADPVHRALGDDSQRTDVLPVQMVSPEAKTTWFLDKDAASKL